MILELIVQPHNAEGNGTLGFDHTLKDAGFLILGMGIDQRLNREKDFLDGLQKQLFVGVLGTGLFQNALNILIHGKQPPSYLPRSPGP